MKPENNPRRRLAILICGLIAVAAVAGLLRLIIRPEPQVNGDRLVAALGHYARDCRKRGEAVPPQVKLDTLVRAGYLQPEDVKAFAGMEVFFNRDAVDTMPQSILMEAHLPDGSVEAVLADGSVQQFSPQRWQQLQSNFDRAVGASNATPPRLQNQTNISH